MMAKTTQSVGCLAEWSLKYLNSHKIGNLLNEHRDVGMSIVLAAKNLRSTSLCQQEEARGQKIQRSASKQYWLKSREAEAKLRQSAAAESLRHGIPDAG
jgi:uncharacterized caspase-like protein